MVSKGKLLSVVTLAVVTSLGAVPAGAGVATGTGIDHVGPHSATVADQTPTAGQNDTAATFDIGNAGASYYTVDGDQQPSLTLERGKTYEFVVETPGHPFHVSTDADGGSLDSVYTRGVNATSGSREGAVEEGTLRFTVPEDAPDTLYYQCGFHTGMGAKLNVGNGTDGTPDYQSPNGSVAIESPDDNATVVSPVRFDLESEGFVVESAANGVRPGHGHLHLLVDRQAVPAGQQVPFEAGYNHYGDGATNATLDLAPGNYTVRLQAGDANHTAYNLTDSVEITVVSSAPSVPEVSEDVAAAVAGDDARIDRSDVVDLVRGYLRTGTVDGIPVDRSDVVAVVKYYIG
jgi:hypothetical protein